MLWWCSHYNRPLKDPILKEYTLEDLMYEYHLIKEKQKHYEEMNKEESDRIEEEKAKADDEWVKQMEEEEAQEKAETINPINNPINKEWMQKHIDENKLFFGDDFGEDLSLNFDSPEEDE
jgi:hypothetical protein